MNIETHLTTTEACTLIAHEAVSMLDAVQEEIPQSVREYRTALEALTTVHNLGKDGETLLGWLDTEITNAERYAAEGINLPCLIDMCRLDTEPDAMAQMDLVWLLFETAAMEGASRSSGGHSWVPRGRSQRYAGWTICSWPPLSPTQPSWPLGCGMSWMMSTLRSRPARCPAPERRNRKWDKSTAPHTLSGQYRGPLRTLRSGPPAIPTVSAPLRAFAALLRPT